ncbi:Transcription factor kayak [Nymphon striatum]|nr:Transcription factor kayak [Nymphon striatum]
MYSSTASNSSETSTDSRMAVADILSSMSNHPNGDSNVVTSFSSFDGYTSGIPTRTTPTLTPTTLKNIEDFIELQSVPPEPIKHQHQAGFVPPLVSVPTNCSNFYDIHENSDNSDAENSMDDKSNLIVDQSMSFQHSSNYSDTSTTVPSTSKPRSTGRMGGRRPNNNELLTPEEAERREMRRERNKLAAARCRKRRLDHTNILVQETEGLEDKRQSLQSEIQMLECQKEELKFILEAHKATCRINMSILMEDFDVKTVLPPVTDTNDINHTMSLSLSRPTSLPVTSQFLLPQLSHSSNTINARSETLPAGISITTPSHGIFNFESYMEGGTGLTPVSSSGITPVLPSCSMQQRNSSSDLSSPETVNPPKLVSL